MTEDDKTPTPPEIVTKVTEEVTDQVTEQVKKRPWIKWAALAGILIVIILIIIFAVTRPKSPQLQGELLKGTVLSADGNPVNAALVTNGQTTIATLPDGTFTINAASSDTLVASAHGFLAAEAPAGSSTITLTAQPPGAVYLTVVDPNGREIAGAAVVRLDPNTSDPLELNQTDQAGQVTFSEVPPSKATFIILHDDYDPGWVETAITTGKTSRAAIKLQTTQTEIKAASQSRSIIPVALAQTEGVSEGPDVPTLVTPFTASTNDCNKNCNPATNTHSTIIITKGTGNTPAKITNLRMVSESEQTAVLLETEFDLDQRIPVGSAIGLVVNPDGSVSTNPVFDQFPLYDRSPLIGQIDPNNNEWQTVDTGTNLSPGDASQIFIRTLGDVSLITNIALGIASNPEQTLTFFQSQPASGSGNDQPNVSLSSWQQLPSFANSGTSSTGRQVDSNHEHITTCCENEGFPDQSSSNQTPPSSGAMYDLNGNLRADYNPLLVDAPGVSASAINLLLMDNPRLTFGSFSNEFSFTKTFPPPPPEHAPADFIISYLNDPEYNTDNASQFFVNNPNEYQQLWTRFLADQAIRFADMERPTETRDWLSNQIQTNASLFDAVNIPLWGTGSYLWGFKDGPGKSQPTGGEGNAPWWGQGADTNQQNTDANQPGAYNTESNPSTDTSSGSWPRFYTSDELSQENLLKGDARCPVSVAWQEPGRTVIICGRTSADLTGARQDYLDGKIRGPGGEFSPESVCQKESTRCHQTCSAKCDKYYEGYDYLLPDFECQDPCTAECDTILNTCIEKLGPISGSAFDSGPTAPF